MIDDLATFAARLPSWCGPDGFPLSYRHFKYGMDWIGRDEARTVLRDASSTRAAGAMKDDYRKWRRGMTREI